MKPSESILWSSIRFYYKVKFLTVPLNTNLLSMNTHEEKGSSTELRTTMSSTNDMWKPRLTNTKPHSLLSVLHQHQDLARHKQHTHMNKFQNRRLKSEKARMRDSFNTSGMFQST